MNTKGTKFLAAISILAIVAAAFVMVIPGAMQTDADGAGYLVLDAEVASTDIPETLEAGPYLVTKDTTVKAVAGVTPIFYVVDGKTLTITGAADAGVITIYAAGTGSTETAVKTLKEKDDDTSLDNSVAVKAFADKTTKVKAVWGTEGSAGDTIVPGTASSFIVEGAATEFKITQCTVTGVLGNEVTVPAGKEFTYTLANFAIQEGLASSYSYSGTTITAYGTKTAMAMTDGMKFVPMVGGVTVSGGDNSVLVQNYLIKETNTEKKLVGDGLYFDYVAEGTVLTMYGTLTTGEVKAVSGSFVCNGVQTSDITAGTVVTGVLATGTESIGATTKVYSAITDANTVIVGDYSIPGKSTKIAWDISVLENSRLVIPAGYTMTFGQNKYTSTEISAITITVPENGYLDVWGKLNAVTGKNSATTPAVVVPMIANSGNFIARAGSDITGFISNGDTTIIGDIDELPAAWTYVTVTGILNNSPTYTDLIADNLTVPEGKTLTVSGMIAIDDPLVIEGTLVIEKGAQIGALDGSAVIKLGEKGKIENSGIIGKHTSIEITNPDETSYVEMNGLSGIAVGITKQSDSLYVTVSGAMTALSSAYPSAIAVGNVVINGDTTVPTGATMTVATGSTLSGKDLTVNGKLVLTGDLKTKGEAGIYVSGYMAGTGKVLLNVTVLGKDIAEKAAVGTAYENYIVIESTADDDDANPAVSHSISGYKIDVVKTKYINDDGDTMYYQRAYISGTIGISPSKASSLGWSADGPTFEISNGPLFVAADTELKQPTADYAVGFGTNGNLVVEGKMSSASEIPTDVIGAIYTGTEETAVYYAVDVNTGLTGIASYKEKTLTLSGLTGYTVDLAYDLDILKDWRVEYANDRFLIIPEGVTLTIMADGFFEEGSIKAIDGKLVVMADGTCNPDSSLYQVYSEDADGNITYCGFQTALSEALPGQTVTLTGSYGTDGDKTSLSIPANVKVVVDTSGVLKITKNVSVATGGELIVDGTFTFGATDSKNAKITVLGTVDLSSGTSTFINYEKEGSTDTDYTMTITSEGAFIYKTTQAFDGNIKLVGAKYVDGSNTVLTTLAKAIEKGGNTITISEDYTSTESIVLGAKTLNITGTVAVGSIDITDGTLNVTAPGKLTSEVTGKSDASDDVSLSLITFTGSIEDKSVSGVYTMDIKQLRAGSLSLDEGDAVLSDAAAVVAKGQYLIVANGTELSIGNSAAITNNGTISVLGLLTVKEDGSLIVTKNDSSAIFDISGIANVEGDLTADRSSTQITGDVLTLSGLMSVEGSVTLYKSTVTGTLSIYEDEENTGVATIKDPMTVGASTIGANGVIIGKLTLETGKWIAAFPGSTIDEKTLTGKVSSAMYINDTLYLTAYANSVASVRLVSATGVVSSAITVPGYNMSKMTTAGNWKDLSDKALTDDTNYIGTTAAAYFEGTEKTVSLMPSVATGLSLYVDGVKATSGKAIEKMTMGVHEVSVTFNPGYTGTKYIEFEGEKITLSMITITPEMVDDGTQLVLSALGDVIIDEGETPEPSEPDNTVMYVLLVVLVILTAIMTIVVVLRMNRS